MPESVTDRPTKSHEYLFLLTKSERYYYNHIAVMENAVSDHPSGNGYKRDARLSYKDKNGARGNNETWKGVGGTRNRRTVWTINSQPFAGAHFAVFPPKLVEPCILAGTSERGCCAECGKPYRRVIEKGLTAHDGDTQTIYPKGTTSNRLALLRPAARARGGEYVNQTRTMDWQPTCACSAPVIPCTVLDPFNGSGTTGLVAVRLNRRYVGIELNPDYVTMAAERLDRSQQQAQLVF